MKQYLTLGVLALFAATFTGCNDFLDDNRYPQTQETNSPAFWSNQDNVEQEANLLLNVVKGYGAYYANVTSSSNISTADFYFSALSDDQVSRDGNGQQWTFINVPTASADYNAPYYNIRQCMYIWDGVESSSLKEDVKKNYIGIARLNRAIETFKLVKRYGNVIWVDKLVDVTDNGLLYGQRQDRDEVMDKVLEDLDYAVANISKEKDVLNWSKDLALAVKAEICLYEGTYCKYRTLAENGKDKDETRAQKFLEECVKACQSLMSKYTLCNDYLSIYQTASIAGFIGNSEMIFGKAYQKDVLGHGTAAYTCTSTPINGITKDAFDAYLFKDGLPLGLTTLNNTDAGYMQDNSLYIGDLLAVRDDRLSWVTDDYAYCAGMTWSRAGSDPMGSSTGYGVRKFDNTSLEAYYRRTIGQNYTCAPQYWLSYVLCQFAEAKAELGNITQTDVDKSINLLYKRAGLPDLNLASIFHDPANTIGVSDIVWEARRCRRCELIMDKDLRYWDLIRWHMLDKLDNTNPANMATWVGANMVNAVAYTDPDIKATLNWEGTYLSGKSVDRRYDKKYYFYPIPGGQIQLNPSLGQNPGW